MGLGHSPRIVTDGLVLALDAGNPKNYNVGISTNWTDKVGGNNGTLVGGTHHNDGPFVGAGYVEFDGNGDKLSCTPSNLTGEFTIEGWWYANAFPATTVLFGNWGGGCLLRLGNEGSELQWYTTGLLSGMRGSIGFTLSTGTWYHVAVSRDSSNVHRTFVNGTQIASETNSDSISMSNLCIGSENTSSGTTDIWNGYISNFRIVDGTALYTSDFTVPTKPLTAITNTVLLTCQGNTIADASSSGHTITVNGDATANLGFPASAFEFDGVDDYATLSSSQIAPGTGAFTWSFWAKHIPTAETGVGTKSVLFSGTGSNTTYGGVYMDSLTYGVFYYATGYRIADYDTAFNDQWWHIAFVGNGGVSGSRTLKLYRNGVQAGSTYTYDYNFTSTTPYIGRNHSYAPESMRGFISNTTYYNRELTASEISQNYNALRSRYGI